MPLTGAWLRNVHNQRAKEYAPWHKLDPEHSDADDADPNPNWQAPPYHASAPSGDVIANEFVTVTPGIQLDRTPNEHDYDVTSSTDDGADERNITREPHFQFSNERYDATETVFSDWGKIPDAALRRGLNAEPLNNPPDDSYYGKGYRNGYYRRTWTEHDFSPEPRRHGFSRWLRPRVAAKVGDSPPPQNPTPYNSPFSSLAEGIGNKFRSPMMRRIPPNFDETAVEDGSGQYNDVQQSIDAGFGYGGF